MGFRERSNPLSALLIYFLSILKCRVCHILNIKVHWGLPGFLFSQRCYIFDKYQPPTLLFSFPLRIYLTILSHLPAMFRINLSSLLPLPSP